MIKEQIKTLENLIDREIDGYRNIEKLYVDKKEILIHGKGTDLYDVDSKIVNTYKNLNDLSDKRKTITKSLNIPTFSMTDLINNIREQDIQTAENLEQKRVEVKELAQKIFQLEKVNIELVKHGIHMTNKSIEIILNGASAITKEYNQKGQNISKEQLEMSSIIEEA